MGCPRYYQRVGRRLGFGEIPGPPQAKPVIVVVPVAGVSRLTRHAISEALSISAHVIAVTVVAADPDQSTLHTDSVRHQWDRWNPGIPLRVLHTQYASMAGPIVAFIDKLRQQHDRRIIVLIPVVRPDHLRDRLLHNQIDLVLTRALRTRTDIIPTRVTIPLQPRDDGAGPGRRARREAGQGDGTKAEQNVTAVEAQARTSRCWKPAVRGYPGSFLPLPKPAGPRGCRALRRLAAPGGEHQ